MSNPHAISPQQEKRPEYTAVAGGVLDFCNDVSPEARPQLKAEM